MPETPPRPRNLPSHPNRLRRPQHQDLSYRSVSAKQSMASPNANTTAKLQPNAKLIVCQALTDGTHRLPYAPLGIPAHKRE